MDVYPKIRLEWVPSAYRHDAEIEHIQEPSKRSIIPALYNAGGTTGSRVRNLVKRPRYK